MSNRTTSLLHRMTVLAVILGVGMTIAACDIDEIFNVQNPGAILDEDLNTRLGLNSLVVGASAEMSDVFDVRVFGVARATDEMKGSGSYFLTSLLREGKLDYREVEGFWEQPHESRWAAEEAIRRFDLVLGDEAPQDSAYARAHILSGIGHQNLGEMFCELAYEGSGRLPRDTAFSRALNMFRQGETLASGVGNQNLVTAARAGQAVALFGLAVEGEGSWADAAAMAAQVPTGFEYYAFYDENDNWNEVWDETFQRHEISAWGTYVADVPQDDPRTPWTDCREAGACRTELGADGQTPHFRQEIYTHVGADIPVLSGIEARMIEAEHYLYQNDMGMFIAKINEARAHYGLDPLDAPADQQAAWDVLDRERFLNLWLRGKRLYDLDRWDRDQYEFTMYTGSAPHQFVYGGDEIDETDLDRRDTCMPIPFSECQANENVRPCP
jgi:hypothetical protein